MYTLNEKKYVIMNYIISEFERRQADSKCIGNALNFMNTCAASMMVCDLTEDNADKFIDDILKKNHLLHPPPSGGNSSS